MKVSVLTISDRASSGVREDRSGPLLVEKMENEGWRLVHQKVVPDDQEGIQKVLCEWADSGEVDVILTTGGTGFAPRDQAPEATRAVVERFAPGLVEAMRQASLRITPHAMLSRAVAGIRGKTLIVNLPGSPRAAQENLAIILPALPHAIELMKDDPAAETGHQPSKPDYKA